VVDRYYRQLPFVLHLPSQFTILWILGILAFSWITGETLREFAGWALLIGAIAIPSGVVLTKHWRVNFRGTWGHVGIREPVAVPSPATPVIRFAILPIQNRDIGRGPPRSEFQWEGCDFVRQSTKYSVGLAKVFSLQYYQS